MTDISKLKFDQNGLIPAIVTETGTGKVLMMAYMNEKRAGLFLEQKPPGTLAERRHLRQLSAYRPHYRRLRLRYASCGSTEGWPGLSYRGRKLLP